MRFNLFRRSPRADTIDRLYGAIVAQARTPVFYRDFGVADTPEGRLEMIMLHAVLVLDRLKQEDDPGRRLGQDVFDRFCADMDANLREMAVGDLAVPRKMKAIGEAFYGRQAVYGAALANGAPALEAALSRNVYAASADVPNAGRLAMYVRAAASELQRLNEGALARGELRFPDPNAFRSLDCTAPGKLE